MASSLVLPLHMDLPWMDLVPPDVYIGVHCSTSEGLLFFKPINLSLNEKDNCTGRVKR